MADQTSPKARDAPPQQAPDKARDGAHEPAGPQKSDGLDQEGFEQQRPAELAEIEAQLRRAWADLDNLRKRFDREMVRERASQRASIASMWFPVVDNLERALEHAGTDPDLIIEGVRAVRDQAIAVLAELGFPRFDDIGEPFNPARDEAVGTVASDADPGTIVATVRPGYGTSESVRRPAAVIVSKGPEG